MQTKCRRIGLTGNIACGKSAVAEFLSQQGVPVLDADQVARGLSQKSGAAYPEIVAEFGSAILDSSGEIDRARLREIVFQNPILRRRLESILHPRIQQASADFFNKNASAPLVVYEASLLFEAGRTRDFDGILVVTCPEVQQILRLRSRSPTLTQELAEQMLRSQMPQSEKARMATWVIENNGELPDLREKTKRWLDSVHGG